MTTAYYRKLKPWGLPMPESDDAGRKESRKDREERATRAPDYHYDSYMEEPDDPPVLGTTPFTKALLRCIGRPDPEEDPDHD